MGQSLPGNRINCVSDWRTAKKGSKDDNRYAPGFPSSCSADDDDVVAGNLGAGASTNAVSTTSCYGRHRANNDLLSYDLDIRVDPERKFISGKNTIRFKMLMDDTRIQLDLFANLDVDRIVLGPAQLKYTRELNTVFVDFPEPLKKAAVYAIDFYYSGFPKETGRFGGISFKKDPAGRHWITTACQGIGASIWWPNKDQQRDEVENMRLRVAIPSALTDVSNGRLVGKTDLGDGYTLA
jgi:aminopeptidase N